MGKCLENTEDQVKQQHFLLGEIQLPLWIRELEHYYTANKDPSFQILDIVFHTVFKFLDNFTF